MFIYGSKRNRIELDLVEEAPAAAAQPAAFTALRATVARAGLAHFGFAGPVMAGAAPTAPAGDVRVATFRDRRSGLLRSVHHEIMLRFGTQVPAARRKQVLAKFGLERRSTNVFVRDQIVVHDPTRKQAGAALVDLAVALADLEEVVFATPNFVSEYRRHAAPKVPAGQWHLENTGAASGQVVGEDVRAPDAWKVTQGSSKIVVAVLDDGVDVDHPGLKTAIWRNPDKSSPDRGGRDFFLPDDDPDHFNPRPKLFRAPFSQMAGNDIHGTACAGVVAARGSKALGIAPRCRLLAVKIFHADDLASDARVADAIRYAAGIADILSCSWSGGASPDIELAIEDAGTLGRGGKGSAVFCATGNENSPVGFPASFAAALGVGASTDKAVLAWYSNTGAEVDFVAPSSGGVRGILTTDVGIPGRGFNTGDVAAGGADGLLTNDFGGTSSATPLAAGIGALALSVNPALDREALREVLRSTAVKIDAAAGAYDAQGKSLRYGFGRLDAAAAVAKAKALA